MTDYARRFPITVTPRPDGADLDVVPALAPAACHCGNTIPATRVAYCTDRCKWADTDHGAYDYDTEDAA